MKTIKMDKIYFKPTHTQMVTGVNSIGLVLITAYTLKSFNELKKEMEELKNEINIIKKNQNENTKRTKISMARISKRIEEQYRKEVAVAIPTPEPFSPPVRKVSFAEEDDNDDIDDALRLLGGV
jgi:hypothetical protein